MLPHLRSEADASDQRLIGGPIALAGKACLRPIYEKMTHHLFKRRELWTSKVSCFIPDQYTKTIHCIVKSIAIRVVAHSPPITPNSTQCLDSKQVHPLRNSHTHAGEIIVVTAVNITHALIFEWKGNTSGSTTSILCGLPKSSYLDVFAIQGQPSHVIPGELAKTHSAIYSLNISRSSCRNGGDQNVEYRAADRP